MTDTYYPKESLVLHTPWIPGADGQPIGQINDTDDSLLRCTKKTELEKKTPELVGRFLSWANNVTVFEATPSDKFDRHRHIATHGHRIANQALSSEGNTKADDNDSGIPKYVSSPFHSHTITLDEEHLQTYPFYPNTEEPIVYEPLHYEVNSYYCNKDTDIPIGAVVFYVGDRGGLPGWRDLAIERLDGRDGRPASPWKDVLLKIVDCWPEARRQGYATHNHSDLSHTHDGGSVDAAKGSVGIDDSDKQKAVVAASSHSHEITEGSVSESKQSSSGEGPNLPRCFNVRILVCATEGATFFKNMIIPHIPRRDRGGSYTTPIGWRPMYPQNPPYNFNDTDDFPFFLKAVDGETEIVGVESGNKTHSHTFSHSHTLKMGGASRESYWDDDADVTVAAGSHNHGTVAIVDDTTLLEEAPNVLPKRDVMLIRYNG